MYASQEHYVTENCQSHIPHNFIYITLSKDKIMEIREQSSGFQDLGMVDDKGVGITIKGEHWEIFVTSWIMWWSHRFTHRYNKRESHAHIDISYQHPFFGSNTVL